MEYLLIAIIVVLCALGNRLRGTGVIKHFCTLNILNKKVDIKFNGNHLYGLMIASIVGVVGGVFAGLAVLVAYLVGESKGWGEWVGALTRWETKDEEWLQRQYKDNEGVGFPYIHQIANAIVKEQIEGTLEEKLKQYHKYATLALTLRGMFWWGLVYGVMALFGVISGLTALAATVVLGIGFPVACWLGKNWKYTNKIGVLSFSRGWENQEVIYGAFQGLTMWITIATNTI